MWSDKNKKTTVLLIKLLAPINAVIIQLYQKTDARSASSNFKYDAVRLLFCGSLKEFHGLYFPGQWKDVEYTLPDILTRYPY